MTVRHVFGALDVDGYHHEFTDDFGDDWGKRSPMNPDDNLDSFFHRTPDQIAV